MFPTFIVFQCQVEVYVLEDIAFPKINIFQHLW